MNSRHKVSRREACAGIPLSALYFSGKAYALEDTQIAIRYFLLPLGFKVDSLTVQPPPSDDMAEASLVLIMQRHRTSAQIAQIKDQSINPIPLF